MQFIYYHSHYIHSLPLTFPLPLPFFTFFFVSYLVALHRYTVKASEYRTSKTSYKLLNITGGLRLYLIPDKLPSSVSHNERVEL